MDVPLFAMYLSHERTEMALVKHEGNVRLSEPSFFGLCSHASLFANIGNAVGCSSAAKNVWVAVV